MRREVLYLQDILEACLDIRRFVEGSDRDSFVSDAMRRRAVLQCLTTIGEAVRSLPDSLLSRYREVPWKDIVGTRHVVVHRYFGLDWDAIWLMATIDARFLHESVVAIIEAEFPGDPAQYLE